MDDFANLKRYAAANQKLNAASKYRIVFFGDSITEFWTPRNSLLFQNPENINRGISGQTTSQMIGRLQQDVIDFQPMMVVILAGINDIAENNGPIALEDIAANIIRMSESAAANHIKVVLCSVLPAAVFSWRKDIVPVLSIIMLNEKIASYAKKHQIPYVDYYSQMVNDSQGLDGNYTDDGVHPNANGYKKMEAIITPFLPQANQSSIFI